MFGVMFAAQTLSTLDIAPDVLFFQLYEERHYELMNSTLPIAQIFGLYQLQNFLFGTAHRQVCTLHSQTIADNSALFTRGQ